MFDMMLSVSLAIKRSSEIMKSHTDAVLDLIDCALQAANFTDGASLTSIGCNGMWTRFVMLHRRQQLTERS